jgi:hypothetical protein
MHSKELHLSRCHLKLKDYKSKFSGKKVKIQTEDSLNEFVEAFNNSQLSENPKLYSVSFSAPHNEWEDEDFRSYLQKLVKPRKPIELLKVPQDCITVALHVRTGAGFDTKDNIQKMPTKFPPQNFYINGLRQVAEYYKDQPLYVYIFTDFPEPSEIAKNFLDQLNLLNINNQLTINYRQSKNNYKTNVLEDFFSMMQFDCMIRPDSSYSRASAAISGPVVEIVPAGWGQFRTDDDGKLIVDCLVKVREHKAGPICDRFISN